MPDLTPDDRAFVEFCKEDLYCSNEDALMLVQGSVEYANWRAACAYKDAEYKARIETLEKALEELIVASNAKIVYDEETDSWWIHTSLRDEIDALDFPTLAETLRQRVRLRWRMMGKKLEDQARNCAELEDGCSVTAGGMTTDEFVSQVYQRKLAAALKTAHVIERARIDNYNNQVTCAVNDAPAQLRALVEIVEVLTTEKEARDRAIEWARKALQVLSVETKDGAHYSLQDLAKLSLANIEKELGG